ncbi:DUF1704 domain containing protein [Lysobacter dokdonensis DS-58]|uniref:DUF1704 domain containing protein n=1 Tax=Lysobacter dokdonensis DS-58 TaxID=1300345 RepID=A0A0A2WKQ8_9GAMM|nr:DUF1674 domain-containing protein [Lysobacter dokdonensis]KGQ20403.1 DUF1704 domain containing protein [Lysobacter dokdonensis DS-58]
MTPRIIGQSEPATDAGTLPDGAATPHEGTQVVPADDTPAPTRPVEIGGRKGPDPVRYGDWEKNGRCIDF